MHHTGRNQRNVRTEPGKKKAAITCSCYNVRVRVSEIAGKLEQISLGLAILTAKVCPSHGSMIMCNTCTPTTQRVKGVTRLWNYSIISNT